MVVWGDEPRDYFSFKSQYLKCAWEQNSEILGLNLRVKWPHLFPQCFEV